MFKQVLSLFRAISEGRFLYLLISLLLYLGLSPFLVDYFGLRLAKDVLLTAILIAATVAVSRSKVYTLTSATLAVLMLATLWYAYFFATEGGVLVAGFFSLFYMSLVSVAILSFVFSAREVTRHVIFAAVSVYLLFGIVWSIIYMILETLVPGSFALLVDSPLDVTSYLTYFSFVTLTTVGYGDITPISLKAKAFANLESLIGQIYMTVLIAWLVGLYVSHKFAARSK
jgi:voltage-gated potassium channel